LVPSVTNPEFDPARSRCQRNDLVVAEVFVEEGESAKTAKRTKFIELMSFCRLARPRIDLVVVYSLNRFSRSVRYHHEIRNLLSAFGTGLRSVTETIEDTAQGRFQEAVIAAVSQFDNDVRAERTIVGMKEANRLGRFTWKAPIGYLNGPRRTSPSLIVDPVTV
jgi:DNA invertase Pin-like site-specific DNA recombinase